MQRLEVSGAVRPIYGSLGVRRLKQSFPTFHYIVLHYLLLGRDPDDDGSTIPSKRR